MELYQDGYIHVSFDVRSWQFSIWATLIFNTDAIWVFKELFKPFFCWCRFDARSCFLLKSTYLGASTRQEKYIGTGKSSLPKNGVSYSSLEKLIGMFNVIINSVNSECMHHQWHIRKVIANILPSCHFRLEINAELNTSAAWQWKKYSWENTDNRSHHRISHVMGCQIQLTSRVMRTPTWQIILFSKGLLSLLLETMDTTPIDD